MWLLAVACTDEGPRGQADANASGRRLDAPRLRRWFAVAIDVTDVLWVVDDSCSMADRRRSRSMGRCSSTCC